VTQQAAVNELANEYGKMLAETRGGTSRIIKFFFTKLNSYITTNSRLQEFRSSFELLIEGFLTPTLVDARSLSTSLIRAQREIKTLNNKAELVFTRFAGVYNSHIYIYARHRDHLFVTIRFDASYYIVVG